MTSMQARREMHAEFVQEIHEKRTELQKSLDDLATVEAFHLSKLREYGVDPDDIPASEDAERDFPQQVLLPEPVVDGSRKDSGPKKTLDGGTLKHDAAEWAIRDIGRPAKVGEIVDRLHQANYGKELSRRILHNSLHTAMARKTDTFEKVSPGVWGLIGQKGSNKP